MVTDTREKAFQADIVAHLVSTGYYKRTTLNFNKAACLDPETVLKFILDTQEREWKKFQKINGDRSEEKFFFRLVKEIDAKGTINILRNGFKDMGCTFQLFYPKPNNHKNPDLFKNFEKNIFTVVDELKYESKEDSNRLDLVIFVNGIPILTIELKDTFSQGVENAINQYKTERDPEEPLFEKTLFHFSIID